MHLRLVDKKDNVEAMRVIETVLKVKASSSEPTVITAPMADPGTGDRPAPRSTRSNIHLAEISVQEPTLDEVFMVLTGETKLTEKGADLPMTMQNTAPE